MKSLENLLGGIGVVFIVVLLTLVAVPAMIFFTIVDFVRDI